MKRRVETEAALNPAFEDGAFGTVGVESPPLEKPKVARPKTAPAAGSRARRLLGTQAEDHGHVVLEAFGGLRRRGRLLDEPPKRPAGFPRAVDVERDGVIVVGRGGQDLRRNAHQVCGVPPRAYNFRTSIPYLRMR